jgi:hypothetical protein
VTVPDDGVAPLHISSENVQVILMPSTVRTDEIYGGPEPSGVGSVSIFRGRFEALLTMPGDALAPVLQMLIAEKFRFCMASACVIGAQRSKVTVSK